MATTGDHEGGVMSTANCGIVEEYALLIGSDRAQGRLQLEQRNVKASLPKLNGFGVQQRDQHAFLGKVDAPA